MRKIILMISLLLIGCSNGNEITISKEEYQKLKGEPTSEYPKYLGRFSTGEYFEQSIHVIVIDSCEYVGHITGSNSATLTHKGNCKFCKERDHEHK